MCSGGGSLCWLVGTDCGGIGSCELYLREPCGGTGDPPFIEGVNLSVLTALLRGSR